MKDIRIRGIIEILGGIAFIHRIKMLDGEEENYFMFPGGGIEENESQEQALKREIHEELGINVNVKNHLFVAQTGENIHNYYYCEYVSGEFGSGNGPEYNDDTYTNSGTYEPIIISYNEIKNKNILPHKIKQEIMKIINEKINFEDVELKKIVVDMDGKSIDKNYTN